MIESGEAETVFKATEEKGRDRSEDEINQPYDEKDLGVFEGLRGDHLPFARQFDAGDHVRERRVLDQIDHFIAATGEGTAEGLGKNNRADHFDFRKPQGLGGQPLPLLYRQESAAHIFGMISCTAKSEAQDGSQKRGQIDSDVGQSEIPDKELNHQREPAEDGNVSIGQEDDPGASVNSERSHQNPEHKPA